MQPCQCAVMIHGLLDCLVCRRAKFIYLRRFALLPPESSALKICIVYPCSEFPGLCRSCPFPLGVWRNAPLSAWCEVWKGCKPGWRRVNLSPSWMTTTPLLSGRATVMYTEGPWFDSRWCGSFFFNHGLLDCLVCRRAKLIYL